MQIAGLIFDDSGHYLDHLGPFCALGSWPLIVCEPELAECAKKFYPDLDVRYVPIRELNLPKFTITCDTQKLVQAYFPPQRTEILWLPHGNSDKGWHGPFFEALQDEIIFVYGRRMIDFINEKGVVPKKIISIGNFRHDYFYKTFENIAVEGKNFLYAPTWDHDNSFWSAFPHLAKRLPNDCNLLVKLHPNTVRKFGPEIEVLIGKYAKQKNIVFLEDEPHIYPLLAKCTAYIGDMSSIGYDFLTFNRPMYFLNANQSLPLHRCGTAIEAAKFDFRLCHPFAETQKALYQYTFESNPNWKEQVNAHCSL